MVVYGIYKLKKKNHIIMSSDVKKAFDKIQYSFTINIHTRL